MDLGTGARAAYRQIVAEELDVDIDRITMFDGDTGLCPDQGGTGGSTGISGSGMQIRQAAASARQALLAMAAARLNAPASGLTVANGVVSAANGQTVSYPTLIEGKGFDVKLVPNAPLKDPDRYVYVAKDVKRPDVPAKVTGRHTYLHDFRLPGMLHARVIRPYTIGATLAEVDKSSIANIPGARVVRINNFLAVVAEREWNAVRAARALRARWTGGGTLSGSDQVYAAMRATEVVRDESLAKNGDAQAAMNAPGVRHFSATYEWPAQSHASLGPSCSVADFRPDGLTVWSASQSTHGLRRNLARDLKIPANTVRVIYMDGSGSYGTNGGDDAAADAALISRAIGRPVRLQWMRHDETGFDPKGPPQLLDMRAALDAQGNVAAWETVAFLPENTPNLPSRPMLGFVAAGIPQPVGQSSAQIQGNAWPCYELPNMAATVHWLKTTPLRPSNLRAPGKPGNAFAVEGFFDELAVAAGRDPLEYRLAHLKDEYGRRLLNIVAERMAWQPRPAPNRNTSGDVMVGRGITYIRYKHADNRMAMAVEVSVARATGKVRVTKVVAAVESGLMINPNSVRNQVEGNIIQAISRTLLEETVFDKNGVTSVDWRSYPILGLADTPVMDIVLDGTPRDKPLGAGEAALAPIPAAIGNAVFDATGLRFRRVPLTQARVLAALRGGRA